jgi:hypothetical protein
MEWATMLTCKAKAKRELRVDERKIVCQVALTFLPGTCSSNVLCNAFPLSSMDPVLQRQTNRNSSSVSTVYEGANLTSLIFALTMELLRRADLLRTPS